MTHLCNSNFVSEYCIINGENISVYDYIQNKDNITSKLVCQNGHELMLVNGNIRKPHFRHVHSCDLVSSPMTDWHIEWQSCFPVTEKCYQRKPSQIKERRADVVLNETKILEIGKFVRLYTIALFLNFLTKRHLLM